jgi:two-component system chemotaxis response regulator CheB
MIVDDSAIIRTILRKILSTVEDFEIVAEAGDGQAAIETIVKLPLSKKPNVVILDIQMPRMDGIEALPKILEFLPDVKVIIASTLSQKNAEISLKALDLGAADYIPKPSLVKEGRDAVETFTYELIEKVKAHGTNSRKRFAPASTAAPSAPIARPQTTEAAKPALTKATETPKRTFEAPKPEAKKLIAPAPNPAASSYYSDDFTLATNTPAAKPAAIAIGSSTGGPEALNKVLSGLKNFDNSKMPIFITQHMPPHFTKVLADNLTRITGKTCKEAIDGETVTNGIVYIAPGDFHLVVERSGLNSIIRLNQNAPENFCRPAVDPMLRSLSLIYGKNLLVVILTGMGSDGMRGSQVVYENGGTIIAQDRETSVVWGMPGATAKAGICKKVLPLEKIPDSIMEYCR